MVGQLAEAPTNFEDQGGGNPSDPSRTTAPMVNLVSKGSCGLTEVVEMMRRTEARRRGADLSTDTRSRGGLFISSGSRHGGCED